MNLGGGRKTKKEKSPIPVLRTIRSLPILLLVGFSAGVLAYRWNMPLASPHAFRETQTASTVYWMLRGGPWINYQTPVMGPPWTIPFEFPTFQWIVGCVASLPISLDNAGRLVSWGFLMATAWPIMRLT